ncbi:transmembrane protein 26-like [Synchiropus picturatus]
MSVIKVVCAVITRALFVLLCVMGISRVIWLKGDRWYWLLTVLLLPLVAETIVTLKRRRGQGYKWFSPVIFFFLSSMIPSIWILELHNSQNLPKYDKCTNLDSLDSIYNVNTTAIDSMHLSRMQRIVYIMGLIMPNVCPYTVILAYHQILLILLIVGKWLLPLGSGVTKDELSQLLLMLVGTAADILEFTSETLSDVNSEAYGRPLVYIVLIVWTWSMLQFPFQLAVVNTKSDGEGDQDVKEVSFLSKHSTDIWNVVVALFIQDGPFLVARLLVMIGFSSFHQMLVFYAIKNFLVVILNLYRLVVICVDFRRSRTRRDRVDP